MLDEELGTEPGPDTQRLYEEIRARRAGEPELSADLWERVGDLRLLSGDAVGAAKAFGQALDAGGAAESRAPIERKCAEAWLMQHRPDIAGPHLDSGRGLGERAGRAGPAASAHANQAWESGEIDQRATLC